MKPDSNCKGCRETVRMTPDEIIRKYVEPLKLSPGRVVADDEYQRRLSLCQGCSGLEYGTTCKYCGCLVHVKAKLNDSRCAYPYAPKWGSSAAHR